MAWERGAIYAREFLCSDKLRAKIGGRGLHPGSLDGGHCGLLVRWERKRAQLLERVVELL